MAAILDEPKRKTIIYIEQRYRERQAWMTAEEKDLTKSRIMAFYASLGVSAVQARIWEAARTSYDGGWRNVRLDVESENEVERFFFGSVQRVFSKI